MTRVRIKVHDNILTAAVAAGIAKLLLKKFRKETGNMTEEQKMRKFRSFIKKLVKEASSKRVYDPEGILTGRDIQTIATIVGMAHEFIKMSEVGDLDSIDFEIEVESKDQPVEIPVDESSSAPRVCEVTH